MMAKKKKLKVLEIVSGLYETGAITSHEKSQLILCDDNLFRTANLIYARTNSKLAASLLDVILKED